MKTIICLIIFAIPGTMKAQVLPPKHEWKATLNVVDETGQPVPAANTHVYYGTTNEIAGLTDPVGVFIASHFDGVENLGFYAEKPGYYPFRMSYHMGRRYRTDVWNPVQLITLKKIIKPIPMYAKSVNTHVPDLDKSLGYDLQIGDWLTPYGKGIQSDVLFTAHFDKRDKSESDFKLVISFPDKEDGIQEFSAPIYYLDSRGSELRSAQQAPIDGYKSEWIQNDNRKTGQPSVTNRDLNRNYYFRVRTVLDQQGKIISANYGKIYGDFMTFQYYLNPTPNDRNVEFDPKKNLVKNLTPFEAVKEP